MNSKEFRTPFQSEMRSQEASSDLVDEVISDVLRMRMQTIRTHSMNSKFNQRERPRQVPDIKLQPATDILLHTQALWLSVDGYSFISDSLIKNCFVHKSGTDQSQRNSSVFWAMRKAVVKMRWDITPISATNKQKFQFWDYDFIKAILISIQMDELSESKLHNKISYRLSGDIVPDHLMSIRQHVHSEFASMILHSTSTVYERIRKKYVML